MPKQAYLCIVRSESGKCEKPSPSQMQESFEKFNAWKEKFKDNIVDLGGPLSDAGKVVTSKGVTDGPFIEVKEIAGGYMMISAESMDEAIAVVQESPGVWSPSSSVEIREINTPCGIE
ncbi:MAG: YciI family protein [Bacteroidota bacterium]